MNSNKVAAHCDTLADLMVEGLESGEPGTLRLLIDDHVGHCQECLPRAGALRTVANALDRGASIDASPGFVGRVMNEIRADVETTRDRMPPLWQVFGAAGLFMVLAAVVLGTQDARTDAPWHARALTGFLDQALGFLGVLSHGISDLWETVAPGRALPILAACAVLATGLNIAFAVRAYRRARKTVE